MPSVVGENPSTLCYYRPQRSWGKVICSEAYVKNSVHRRGIGHMVHPPGRYTPWAGTHPRQVPLPGRYTPWAGTHPLPGRHTPRQVHPHGQVHPWADTHPWGATPPRQVHSPGRYPPGQVHPPPLVNERAVRILLECILVN